MTRLWLFLLLLPTLARAQARVEAVRAVQRGDTLEIRYDLRNPTPADSVFVKILTHENTLLPAQTLTGDVGQIRSTGIEKVIFWNMKRDKIRLDGEIQVEVSVKTAVVSGSESKPPKGDGGISQSRPGGGPANALISALAPGIGNAFVQPRKPSGKVRFGLRPLVTVAFYGLLGYGISQKSAANQEYDLYKNSLRESLARPHFDAANEAHHRYYLATRAAAAVWLTDVTATFLRGLKNDRQRRTTAFYVLPGNAATPTTVSFRHQF